MVKPHANLLQMQKAVLFARTYPSQAMQHEGLHCFNGEDNEVGQSP